MLAVSIVTFRSGQVIGQCLKKLFAATSRPIEIIVFDNASDDDTLAHLTPFGNAVRVTPHRSNVGFGCAHNRVLAQVNSEYFLFLNPDVELPPGGLDRLVGHLEENPGCGAVAPLLANGLHGELGGFARSYPGQFCLPRSWRSLPGEIATLQGACVLVRSSLLRSLGGFDERFFLYAEDLDLSLQIRRAGYSLACLTTVVARHLSGHSESGCSSLSVAHRKHAALLKFYDKNYPRGAIFWLLARDLLRFTFRWVVHYLSPSRASSEKASEYRGRIQALWEYVGSKISADEHLLVGASRGSSSRQGQSLG
jgi:GT2 family glycosyltransferase